MVRQARLEGVTRHEVGSVPPQKDGSNRVVRQKASKLGISSVFASAPMVGSGPGETGSRRERAACRRRRCSGAGSRAPAGPRRCGHDAGTAEPRRARGAAGGARTERAWDAPGPLFPRVPARARPRSVQSLRARSLQLAHDRELTRRQAVAVRRSLATAQAHLAQTLRSLYKRGPAGSRGDPARRHLGRPAGLRSRQPEPRGAGRSPDDRRPEAKAGAGPGGRGATARARPALATARRSAEAAAAYFAGVASERSRTLSHCVRGATSPRSRSPGSMPWPAGPSAARRR